MRYFLLALPFVPLGCQAPPAARSEAPPPAFEFLLQRYDVDHDGLISSAEYGKDVDSFARLDRNVDGELDPSDFELSGRRMLGLAPEEARRERARHLLAWYFQGDDRPHELGKTELLDAHRAYDEDGNGWVGRREFEKLSNGRARSGRRPAGSLVGLIENETTDPWEKILEGVDRSNDGFLDAAELALFYDSEAAREGWLFDPSRGVAVARRLTGAVAPDFTLSTIDSAKETITLSDFAGSTAVALIFGSYT